MLKTGTSGSLKIRGEMQSIDRPDGLPGIPLESKEAKLQQRHIRRVQQPSRYQQSATKGYEKL